MLSINKLFLSLFLLVFGIAAYGQSREFYQLKVYTFETEAQEKATDKFLKDAFIPALKRQKITNVGVFKTRPNPDDTLKRTYVLIPFTSLSQFEGLEEILVKDATYLASGSDYLMASYDQAPYQRIESILLKAFEDMPKMKPSPLNGPRKDRIYELRSYESATEAIFKNKVDMFNAGGEVKLFNRLAFNAVFYGEVISGGSMPNLMYMTTHANQEVRETNWKAFVDSPEWGVLKAMPKYQNNVSHIDIFFLYPAEYSDY